MEKDAIYELLNSFMGALNINNAVIRRKKDNELILVSAIGYKEDETDSVKKIREGMSGLCAEKKISIVINDLDSYHDKYFKKMNNIKSAVSIPVLISGKVAATINFASIHKNNFDADKIKILENFAEIYKHLLIINLISRYSYRYAKA